MLRSNCKKVTSALDQMILENVKEHYGTCSMKAAKNILCYQYMIDCGVCHIERSKNIDEAFRRIFSYYEDLQSAFFEIACGMPSWFNFDFILRQDSFNAKIILKKLFEESEEEASKYSFDQAEKQLINMIYCRMMKDVDIDYIASLCLNDRWLFSEETISKLKNIK